MTKAFDFRNGKLVRDALLDAEKLADILHQNEKDFIKKLKVIDNNRYYVRFGFNSLMGFLNNGLNFSRTQSQRIVTQVRRYDPKLNTEIKSTDNDSWRTSTQPYTAYQKQT